MDNLIHSFRRNANEEVRISTRRYQEKDYLDIRVFFSVAQGRRIQAHAERYHRGIGVCVAI